MTYFNLFLDSNKKIFNYSFSQEFLERKYELGVIRINGNIHLFNINSTNNILDYNRIEEKENNHKIIADHINIPQNNYTFVELKNMIYKKINEKEKVLFLNISLDEKSEKIILQIKKNYQVLDSRNSILSFLGFNKKIINEGKHIANNEFKLNNNEFLFLKCNLIENCYINENKTNAILKINNKEHLNIEQKHIIYHKINNTPDKIILYLVDHNNNLVDSNNINLWIELHLKEL